jgi:hypothetical protein
MQRIGRTSLPLGIAWLVVLAIYAAAMWSGAETATPFRWVVLVGNTVVALNLIAQGLLYRRRSRGR